MNFGDWEGQETHPLRDKYPNTFDFRGTFSPNFVKYDKGAESYGDLIDRCNSFMHDLKENDAGKTVLVVYHDFTIRGILAYSTLISLVLRPLIMYRLRKLV